MEREASQRVRVRPIDALLPSSCLRLILLVLTILFVAGLLLHPLQERSMEAAGHSFKGTDVQQLEGGGLGQGVVLAILGGFRTLVADILWLKMNIHWEAQEPSATKALIELVAAVDPRPLFFWTQGARIMAFDMPVWELDEARRRGVYSDALKKSVFADYGKLGLAFAGNGLEHHPDSVTLLEDKAHIYSIRMGDAGEAAEVYRQIAAMDDPPVYAARVCARLLVESGKKMEAYTYLKELYPGLTDAVYDQKPQVLAWIRELEQELNISSEERLMVN